MVGSLLEWPGKEASRAVSDTLRLIAHYYHTKNAETSSNAARENARKFDEAAEAIEGGKAPKMKARRLQDMRWRTWKRPPASMKNFVSPSRCVAHRPRSSPAAAPLRGAARTKRPRSPLSRRFARPASVFPRMSNISDPEDIEDQLPFLSPMREAQAGRSVLVYPGKLNVVPRLFVRG